MLVRRTIKDIFFVSVVIGLIGAYQPAFAQNKGVDVSGAVKEGWKGLEGTRLTLYKNGNVDKSLTTSATGKFAFFFEANANYVLDVSKSGYVTKKIAFNTTVPADINQVWDFDFIVELFQDQSGLDKAIFSNPVAKVRYSARHNEFDYDLDYTMQFQKKEEEVFAELEQLNTDRFKDEERQRKEAELAGKTQAKELAAAQKAKEAAEKQLLAEEEQKRKAAEKEAEQKAAELKAAEQAATRAKVDEFDALMKEGFGLAKAESYTEAKARYTAASQLFPDRQEAPFKMAEMEQLIAQQQKQLAAQKLLDDKYDEALNKGNSLFSLEDHDGAIAAFEHAQELKPDSKEPKDAIAQIRQSLAAKVKAEDEERTLGRKYDEIMAEASSALIRKNFEASKELYMMAAQLKPGEAEPKARIQDIELKLTELRKQEEARKEKEQQVKQLLADADQALKDDDLTAAQAKFFKATTLDPSNTEAKAMLKKTIGLLGKKNKEESEQRRKRGHFDRLMNTGNAFSEVADHKGAIDNYQQALNLNIDNSAAKAKLAEVEELKKKTAEEKILAEKLDRQYAKLISGATDRYVKNDYESSLKEFKQALELKPDATEPKERITEIEGILVQVAAQQEQQDKKEEEFQSIVATGQQLFSKKEYERAKTDYLRANQIMPNDGQVIQRLKAIDEILEKQALEAIALKAKEEADKRTEDEKVRLKKEKKLREEAEAKAIAEAEKLTEIQRKKEEVEQEAQRIADELNRKKAYEEAARVAELARIEKERQEQIADQERARIAEDIRKKEEVQKLADEKARQQRELIEQQAENARLQAEEQARMEEEDRKRMAEEAARLVQEEEERRLAEVRKAEDERRAKLAEEDRIRKEEDARSLAEAKATAEAERMIQLEKGKAEAEVRKKAEKKVEEELLIAERLLQEQRDTEEQKRSWQQAKERERLAAAQDSIAKADAERMQQEAEAILSAELEQKEARMKAEVEATIKKEMQEGFEEEIKQKELAVQQEAAAEAAFEREQELKQRRKEEERQQKMAMIESRKRQEQAGWEEREQKMAEQREAAELAEKARQQKLEEERIQHEKEMAEEAEQVIIAAERNAERSADLEARRLRDEENNARKKAMADEWNQMRAVAQAEREQTQKEADAIKAVKARTGKIELERQRENEKLRREREIGEAAKFAKDRNTSEREFREEQDRIRKAEVALKEENYRNKLEFEKKARELAESSAESGREDYERKVRERMEKEFEEKRAAIEQVEEQKGQMATTARPNQFQMNLADRYPEGITEESEIKRNRQIKRIIVNRGNGFANQYSRVTWNWGGVYYFKNTESTSQQIFDLETRW